ncbi:MAG: hypothetical protein R3A78_00955 [Polyangiales bacterium]
MRRTILSTLLLLATGCAADAANERDLVADPGLVGTGAADYASRVHMLGHIDQDTVTKGGFVRADQFDGYTFSAGPESVVTLEVASAARGLDTTLFVYGPMDSGRIEEIAWDDNSGEGSLAKISNLELPTMGDYLVVVGTALADGRGAYSVALWCDSDVCDPGQDLAAGCDASISEWVDACAIRAANGIEDDAARIDAIQTCMSGTAAQRAYTDICEGDSGPNARVCGGFESFQSTNWEKCMGILSPTGEPPELL